MTNKIITSVLFILLVLSAILNFMLLSDAKINIASPTSQYHTHQEQFQGQLMINMWLQRGDKPRWEQKVVSDATQATDFLNTLHPTSSYMHELFVFEDKITIIYPNIFKSKKSGTNK